MSDLKDSVRAAITNYVSSKRESHTEADVLRVIRDQSILMFERQIVFDALDADPMEQLSTAKDQVDNVKSMLDVVSCNRTVTHDGYSSIEATIQWRQDGNMNKEVNDNLQFYFKYERRRMRPEDIVAAQVDFRDDKFAGNHIGYNIELSKDHGVRERLLTVEVWAQGDGPSQDKAEPLVADGDDWEDMDENEAMEEEGGKGGNDDMEEQPEEMKDDTMDLPPQQPQEENKISVDSKSDKFAAYLDPDVLANLIHWSCLEIDETGFFFLLMTFPFYEQEWDLVGFVLDTVFAESNSDDENESLQAVEFDDDGGDDSTTQSK
jgi:hypothetical protein